VAAPERRGPRRQLAGLDAIDAALRGGQRLRLILVREGLDTPELRDLLQRASASGVRIRSVSAKVVHRLSHPRPPAEILALAGSGPGGTLDELMAGLGAVWLLVDVSYPGNAGFAIRTAEVSGADGIVIDCGFDRTARRDALRLSMRADWFMPVLWERAEVAIDRAVASGHRVIGVEDVGAAAPWQVDLTGPVAFVIGGEERGIPEPVLERCDALVRLPMGGFIRSYNLQAAMAGVCAERLRQSLLADGASD